MDTTTKENIFYEGEDVKNISLLLQGNMQVLINCNKTNYCLFKLDKNIFIGAAELMTSPNFFFTYKGDENCKLFNIANFSKERENSFEELLESKKDYGAYIISSIYTIIEKTIKSTKKVENYLLQYSSIVDNLKAIFWNLKDQIGFPYTPRDTFIRDGLDLFQKMSIKNVFVPSKLTYEFLESDFSQIFENEIQEDRSDYGKIEYYRHINTMPIELRKSFFCQVPYITAFHTKDESELLETLVSDVKVLIANFEKVLSEIYLEGSNCLFNEYVKAAIDAGKKGLDCSSLLFAIEYIIKCVSEFHTILRKEFNVDIVLDEEYLNSMYLQAKNSKLDESSSSEKNEMFIPEDLRNSAFKIVEYSQISEEKSQEFLANLKAFRQLEDRYRFDPSTSGIKKAITNTFFEIYEAVLKRVIIENNESRLMHMFLDFGYMDEKLLDTEHVLALYKLTDKSNTNTPCHVYTSREWLANIYNLTKDPSISEFGEDYFDSLRQKKKRRELNDLQEAKALSDSNKRLNYEISNMFKVNQKLCHGQVSMYFPILHNEMITKNIADSFVTSDAVNKAIQRVIDIDFSIFHREVFYVNASKSIEKELIMKSFAPDIILMPTFGTRAIMWQEITGRSRSSQGRFLLPVLTSENLNEMILKLLGNFRWELCRTMMGVSWNDITQKSLTSEYTDFIQFYKKNKDLSEEAKVKVKSQILRYRNMMRDIFTSDYEVWINYEANGIRRLNKVVRNILYKNCPFAKNIRQIVSNQPMYIDVATQLGRQRIKMTHDLELRYSKYKKNGLDLDPDLENNLSFYRDL